MSDPSIKNEDLRLKDVVLKFLSIEKLLWQKKY